MFKKLHPLLFFAVLVLPLTSFTISTNSQEDIHVIDSIVYNDVDAGFIATNEMVENVRANPINKTRPHIIKYPLLKNMDDYDFPIIIVYGEKDIYGESKQHVKSRFPQAIFVEIKNAGHIAWKHAPKEFSHTLVEFYGI
ncbi:MAG: hypothetical protein KPEEDBHJ_03690 [Anaerolineales bacterium]|nr:hypothetical protein [Anaerolineales bacterium]